MESVVDITPKPMTVPKVTLRTGTRRARERRAEKLEADEKAPCWQYRPPKMQPLAPKTGGQVWPKALIQPLLRNIAVWQDTAELSLFKDRSKNSAERPPLQPKKQSLPGQPLELPSILTAVRPLARSDNSCRDRTAGLAHCR
jgi:hypothetical protein